MSIRVHVRFKGAGRSLSLYYIDPFTSREVSKSAGTRDLREADKAAARWEDELLQHRGRHDDGWQYFRERFEDEHLRSLSRGGRGGYNTALNHVERLISISSLRDITPGIVSTFQSKLLDEGRPMSSVCNYLTHLRTALNWAERVGMIPKAPRVKLPRQPKRTFMRGRPLTEAEYRRMLKACKTVCGADAPAWQRLLELLWLSGLRIGEALQLSWDREPLVVNLDATPYPQLLFYAEGHKARRDDAVPMTPDLAAWLSRTPPKARRGLVAPIPLESLSRASDQITAIGKAAGIKVSEVGRINSVEDDGKWASAHDLRRAFGTRWARKVMPMTLQKLMRHAELSTTLKYYVGLTATDAGREIWGDATPATVPKNVPKSSRVRRKAG